MRKMERNPLKISESITEGVEEYEMHLQEYERTVLLQARVLVTFYLTCNTRRTPSKILEEMLDYPWKALCTPRSVAAPASQNCMHKVPSRG